MNGDRAKSISVPLSFLGEGPHQASLVRDHPQESDQLVLESTTMRSGDSITVHLVDGGGFVGRFTPDSR